MSSTYRKIMLLEKKKRKRKIQAAIQYTATKEFSISNIRKITQQLA